MTEESPKYETGAPPQPLSDDQLKALREMAWYVAIKGDLLIQLIDELEIHREEREDMLKDAQRYEWLRDNFGFLMLHTSGDHVTLIEPTKHDKQLDPGSLDRAIDNAIEREEKKIPLKRSGHCPHGYEFANLDDGTDTCIGCTPERE